MCGGAKDRTRTCTETGANRHTLWKAARMRDKWSQKEAKQALARSTGDQNSTSKPNTTTDKITDCNREAQA